MTESKLTIEEKIKNSIESGKLKMRPRWQFVARDALVFGLGVLIGIGLLYIASFVPYAAHLMVPLILAVIFMVLFDSYVRRHYSMYRRPIIVTLSIILFALIVASFLLARLRAHERFHRFIHTRGVPVFDPFYQRFGPPMPPRMMR